MLKIATATITIYLFLTLHLELFHFYIIYFYITFSAVVFSGVNKFPSFKRTWFFKVYLTFFYGFKVLKTVLV